MEITDSVKHDKISIRIIRVTKIYRALVSTKLPRNTPKLDS